MTLLNEDSKFGELCGQWHQNSTKEWRTRIIKLLGSMRSKLRAYVNSNLINIFICSCWWVWGCFSLPLSLFPQSCSEIEPVFQKEEAQAFCIICSWISSLLYLLQQYPSDFPTPCTTMFVEGSQQGEGYSWFGQGRPCKYHWNADFLWEKIYPCATLIHLHWEHSAAWWS